MGIVLVMEENEILDFKIFRIQRKRFSDQRRLMVRIEGGSRRRGIIEVG